MNNYIQVRDFRCPSVSLDCALKDLFKKYSTPAEITTSYNDATNVLTITINGVAQNITLSDSDNQTLSIGPDGTSIVISEGNSIDLTSVVKRLETPTTLVDNGDGTATYTNEDGDEVTIPIGAATLVDNNDGSYTFTAADGSEVTIETSDVVTTLVDNNDGSFTYTNEAGVSTTFTQADDIVTTVTNTVTGAKIATYTNEEGVSVDINQTITELGTPTLTGTTLTIPFINEAGVTQTVNVDLANLVTVDINVDTLTYTASSNIITLTETDGSVKTIDLSEFSIIATTNLDGSITITQEGVTKFTIPATHPAATVTNNAAAYSWNAATQTLNIPQVPAIVNGQLVQGDGTAAEQIPDFWRVGLGATGALPDGATDVTDVIAHQSDIFVGLDALMRVGHGASNLASNTAVGNNSLNANTSGGSNVAIGFDTLRSNTTGGNNVGIGRDSLYSNTTGSNNTAIGRDSLFANTTGSNNIANGYQALAANTTGGFNVAIGRDSMFRNTTGANNAGAGYRSMYSNTTGNGNSAYGADSLYSNTTGINNTAIGYLSGFSSVGQNNATFVGNQAGRYSVATGYSNNTYIGQWSGGDNVNDVQNSFLGQSSGQFSLGGSNTYLGQATGKNHRNGSQNTAVGQSANQNAEGSNNVVVGYIAAQLNKGDNNTFVGFDSQNILTGESIASATASTTTQITLVTPTTAPVGSVVALSFTTNTIVGSINQSDSWLVVNATTLESINKVTPMSTTGTMSGLSLTFTTRNYSNSSTLGATSRVYSDNQVALGNNLVTTTVFGDKVAFDLVAINAAPIGATLKITGTTVGGHGGTVKIIGV